MADTKISALTAVGTPALTDEFAVNQGGTSKRETLQQVLNGIDLLADAAALADADKLAVIQSSVAKDAALTALVTYLQTKGMPRIARLGSQHSISSGTGTEVTGLSMTLEAGTYVFRYHLIIRQATATTDAPQFGINFTGTSTTKNFILSFADAATALTANTYIMDNVGIKTAGFMDAMAHNALSTTAPNMGTTVGVAATGADILCFIDGLIIVTVAGDLELWRSSEGANASTTEVGSSLTVIRTA
jgi:hypothetical protein